MTPLRSMMLLVALVAAALAAWRIVATCIADGQAAFEPERALAWDSHNPQALLSLARRQLGDGEIPAARATARELLQSDPLAASAFAVLAEAAQADGDDSQAMRLYTLALRRAPRDLHVRAWIADREIAEGRYTDALADLDLLLRISPSQRRTLLPAMADLAAHRPAFADALLQTLARDPDWSDAMLDALLDTGDDASVDRIFGALEQQHRLSDAKIGRWLDRLMQEGRWGEAYSRWASVALEAGGALPAVYDGGFEQPPSGIGFDWRMRDSAGVYIERERTRGASGEYAVRITFLHRRAPEIELAQTLLLAPGAYRLHFRSRAESLHSDKGIEWAITCEGAAAPLAVSAPIEGSSDWKPADIAFDVPADGCPAQRLGLRNPGAGGAGKIVSGTVWFDDVAIDPLPHRSPASNESG